MNKRSIIKIILCLFALIFIVEFYINTKDFSLLYLSSLLFLGTVYMYKFKNKIKKFKFIYDVILMLLMIFSLILFGWIMINIFMSLEYILLEVPSIFNIFILYFILKILIDSIIDLKNNQNKINDYIGIIVLTIINIVFIRYFFDICGIITDSMIQIEFINQNYIYFLIMLITVNIHSYVCSKLK